MKRLEKRKTFVSGLAILTTLIFLTGICYSVIILDLEEPLEPEVPAWRIINPGAGFNYIDATNIPSDGTKGKNHDGKVELRAMNAENQASVVRTFYPNKPDTSWNHDFVPSPLWPTMGKKIGEQCPYDIVLYQKEGDGTYASRDQVDGFVTRTQ